MQNITTTQLRTKSKELVKTLKEGGTFRLIHRSSVIGEITPLRHQPKPITDIEAFKRALDAIRPKKLIPKSQREKVYRKHLEEKHGKNIFRR
ncbi:hypothetical protein HYS91_02575 [Candidatus Daviesbacteria bacterium]|nr:hypothetical protein [Candidatus Daviesbacteria bacterium]